MVLDITLGLEVGVNGPHGENVQELVEQVLVFVHYLKDIPLSTFVYIFASAVCCM